MTIRSATRWRGLVLIVALAGAAVALSSQPQGARAQASAAQLLAERHAPLIMLKAQEHECDRDGEQFAPMSVDLLLDNPEVLLRQVGVGDPVVMRAPGASDLFRLGKGFYLDVPGETFEPGCLYERDYRRYSEGVRPVVYAHIAREAGVEDRLALQYWFFWYFNDWNNKHEGDWEGIQLLFEASSVEEALERDPISAGFAQHRGGERADWDDDKLERRGDRPVVYPSAGSHASYFGSELYLGRSGAEGFGCDDTEGPSREVDPAVVLLPDEVDDATSSLAWLAYDGRWGERRGEPFNGPTGPTAKRRWTEPVSWQEDLRDTSVSIPAGDSLGSLVLDTFCTAAEEGSIVLIRLQTSPLLVFALLGVVASGSALLARRTSWTPARGLPIVRRRRAGQILVTAGELYRRHPLTFVWIGLIYIPINLATGAAFALARLLGPVDTLAEFIGDRSGAGLVLSMAAGSAGNAVAQLIVTAAVAAALTDLDRGVAAGWREPYRAALRSIRPLSAAFIRATLIVVGLALTVIGLPWAIRQLVRYLFYPQAIVIEGLDARDGLRRSTELVDGQWWRTAALAGAIGVAVFLLAVAGGLLILLAVTGLPLWAFNIVTAFLFALLVPVAAAAMTLLYGDLVASSQAEEREEP